VRNNKTKTSCAIKGHWKRPREERGVLLFFGFEKQPAETPGEMKEKKKNLKIWARMGIGAFPASPRKGGDR